MTRIPREYTAQDHLSMAKHFDFNKSTEPKEIARRQELRGRKANIYDDQSAGLDIGTRTLERLEDPEHQAVWAKLYGGAMLNSGLYMLHGVNNQPMSRHFKLARPVDVDGVLQDTDDLNLGTLVNLKFTQLESDEYEAKSEVSDPTEAQTARLGRRLGNSSMLLATFGTEFSTSDTELAIMTQVLDQTTAMHHSVQKLAHRIGVNPSVAQLRTGSTPFGAYIIDNNQIPYQVQAAFRASVGEVKDGRGY